MSNAEILEKTKELEAKTKEKYASITNQLNQTIILAQNIANVQNEQTIALNEIDQDLNHTKKQLEQSKQLIHKFQNPFRLFLPFNKIKKVHEPFQINKPIRSYTDNTNTHTNNVAVTTMTEDEFILQSTQQLRILNQHASNYNRTLRVQEKIIDSIENNIVKCNEQTNNVNSKMSRIIK